VRLPSHITPTQLTQSAENLAVYFSAARVRVYSHEDNLALADIHLDFRLTPPPHTYPDRHIYVWTPLPAGTPAPVFYTDEGNPTALNLHGSSLLLAGNPGSGKSTAIRVLLSSLAQQRNTALFGIDPKAVELAPWRGRFTQLIRGDDYEELKNLLEYLLGVIHDRADYMSREGIITLPPSREFPSVVLVVDEWAEMASTGTKTQRQEIADLLRRYVSLGRAVGCSAILATQRPTGETIDPGTRALLSHRLAFRCGDKWQSEAILGMGHHEPTKISLETPGKAFYSDGATVTPVTVYNRPESFIDPCPVLKIEIEDFAPHSPRIF
jgi:S-DNA-T family DNA segregation ATPase FtsK/SpoIIIE